jgi:hypothetical protein
MANEVRSQRLMQFLQVSSNPALAPFAKFQYIIREIAKSLELDPDKVTNNMDEAALQAELMKGMQAQQPAPEGGPAPAGANPMDTSGAGGGNIGVGQAPHHKNKDLVVMHKDKEHLNKLKAMVSNQAQWSKFEEYLDTLINQQHRTMEQTNESVAVYRSQGAIYQLRRLKLLRDEVLKAQ